MAALTGLGRYWFGHAIGRLPSPLMIPCPTAAYV